MGNTIQTHIDALVEGRDLLPAEAENAFQIIMNGGATPAQMAAFLVALRMKGETAEEICAGATVLRAKAKPFNAPQGAIDTCGTGGDAKGTLNVSTAVAIVVAACGVPVVKHGNRSVSSKSGSSDVLTELGVKIDAEIPVMEEALKRGNLCFLMAPMFHQAMRHVAPVRKELGMRTVFNLLGPLSNPARPKRQVLGVYDAKWLVPMAETLGKLGAERAWIVHGSDGMDELTTTGSSQIAELKIDGSVRRFEVSPEDFGMQTVSLKALEGRGPDYNAQQLSRLLAGETAAYRDIVLLNAAAALVVADKAADLTAGITMAAEAIDSGKAKETLAMLVAITNDPEILNRTIGAV